jgi:predicted nucleotidyltransferase
MEQISYKILVKLKQKRYHIRKLADELDTNHMTIVRRLKELQDENVVDYIKEGKNKRYFLKETAEARNCLYISEYQKRNHMLKKYPVLRKIFNYIEDDKKIKLAILFGSYAKETSDSESDIDIFIESRDRKIKEELENLDSRLSIKMGKYNNANLLIREIEKNYVVIKGVELYYEKSRFFDKIKERE